MSIELSKYTEVKCRPDFANLSVNLPIRATVSLITNSEEGYVI